MRIQNAARNSTEWFERVDRYVNLPPEQFAYSLLTRSQRISHENLRLRDRDYVEAYENWIAEKRRHPACAELGADPADVHAVHRARHDAEESDRGLADGAVLLRRRDPRRLSPRAPRRARDGRRRAGDRRNDLRLARRAHHARLPGDVERGAARRVEAHRRLRPSRQRRQDRAAARPCRCQGIDAGRLGRHRHAARGRQLAADLGVAAAVPRRRKPLVARDDARGHGPRPRRLRARHALGGRGWLRLAGTALRARLPAVVVHLAADQPAHRRVRRLAGEPAALSAGSIPRGARGLARAPADVGADLGARLGRGRHHARRRGGDRARASRRPAPT